MDNLCHSLVGAALAQTGLKRWSARATATLVLATNLPDLDVVAVFLDRGLELRRGLTHGVPALLVLPLLLGALVVGYDRWRPADAARRARFAPLAALATIGVLTHPFLDYLNSYGMRWLMPWRDVWFYGDTLFIVDPWLLLLLGGGAWISRRQELGRRARWERPARVGVALALVYVGGMMVSTVVARRAVARELIEETGAAVRMMVTATPVNPFVKEVIVDEGPHYRVGQFRYLGRPRLSLDHVVAKGSEWLPQYREVLDTRTGRAFTHWARFPVLTPARAYDLRYSSGERAGFATLEWPAP